MTDTIRRTRLDREISSRALADRLGVTPSAVTQLEESERAETIKLSTLRRALEALDAIPQISVVRPRWTDTVTPSAIARAVSAELAAGRDLQAFRVLTDGLRQYRSDPDAFDEEQIAERPQRIASEVWNMFFLASYEDALAGRRADWARARPLAEPTYLFDLPSLRARADANTPPHLRRLGVLIDDRSLKRA